MRSPRRSRRPRRLRPPSARAHGHGRGGRRGRVSRVPGGRCRRGDPDWDRAHSHGLNWREHYVIQYNSAESHFHDAAIKIYTDRGYAQQAEQKTGDELRRLACQDRGYWWWFKHNLGLA